MRKKLLTIKNICKIGLSFFDEGKGYFRICFDYNFALYALFAFKSGLNPFSFKKNTKVA